MPIKQKEYDNLALTDRYLTDPLLLALAWKKAHDYVRNINWYADNFELDKSAINLAERCKEWGAEIEKGVIFSPLDLVPAPKNQEWEFKSLSKANDEKGQAYCVEWGPKEETKTRLRPLAHIGIKEQTIMTLVMMCLANKVESEQGDPSISYEEVHKKKVVSYGNRLYCKYSDDGEAEHNYGATTTYSKFFTDYRKFLQRPYYFANQALPEKSPDEEVYLVELDLTQFFDLIDRKRLNELVLKLAEEQEEHQAEKQAASKKTLKSFEDWEWTSCAEKGYFLCETEIVKTPPKGLPQGLVASGFLSNIYMLSFDTYMSEHMGEAIPLKEKGNGLKLTLIDYCRYVDDMRLVVAGPSRKIYNNKSPAKDIKDAVSNWLDVKLEEINLHLNKSKTKIEVYRGKSKGISTSLEEIQSKSSGPVSFEDTGELLNQLESLLIISGDAASQQTGENCKINRLALIEKSVFDVREDTLRRFAANKISRMLNSMRHFTSRDVDSNEKPLPGEWDYLQERLARRLVACWSRDPALVLLLKKGLELFPSPKLIEPVLEQISHLLSNGDSTCQKYTKQVAIARYCLAEILRHSAISIHRKDPQAIPAQADSEAYFDLLQDYAAKILEDSSGSVSNDNEVKCFDLLSDQARFLLMTRLDTVLERSSGNSEQDIIFKLAKGYRYITQAPESQDSQCLATCILISSQLVTDLKPVIRAASCFLDSPGVDAKNVLERVAINSPSLVRSIILHARPLTYSWYKLPFTKELSERLYIYVKPSAKPLSEITSPIEIYKLSSRNDNPFANEIMALKLMHGLLGESKRFNQESDENIVDLSRTKVSLARKIKKGEKSHSTIVGYSSPPSYETFDLEIRVDRIEFHASLAELSSHLRLEHFGDSGESYHEASVLQKISLAMRAILAGSADPTGFGQSITPKIGYRGIKSTSFKRQFGMMTSPESLAGEQAQFSAWLTTLLSKLLKWPGIHVNDQGFQWPREFTIENVKKLIEERLSALKKSYCTLSSMPGLPELVSPAWDESKRSLVVAMVQSKLPFKKDFSQYGLMLDNPDYRAKHRRHVARIAKLVIQHIEAQHIETPEDGSQENHTDLIIWPELAVHKDDIDILVQLSRKTHAIVFSGLSFMHQNGVKGPNNCALWIVPRKHNGNQHEIMRLQGKQHMMKDELGVSPWRPYQLMLELRHPKFKDKRGFVMTGAICFDATDIALSADLRDKSNAFLVPALNQDVNSFDTMVDALHYHMYQPVVLVNSGEFGSSYAKAPYRDAHKRLIAHSSGNNQVAINTFEINMFDFRRDGVGKSMQSGIELKTAPAGVNNT